MVPSDLEAASTPVVKPQTPAARSVPFPTRNNDAVNESTRVGGPSGATSATINPSSPGDTLPGKPEAHTHTNWDFYVAPHPWGPWRVAGSHAWVPMGYYCPGICPKFNSPDESTIWALTAGDWRNGDAYKLTAVRLSIQ